MPDAVQHPALGRQRAQLAMFQNPVGSSQGGGVQAELQGTRLLSAPDLGPEPPLEHETPIRQETREGAGQWQCSGMNTCFKPCPE